MPKNDIEVFEYLRLDEKTPLEIDFLTYAIFAYRKEKWIEHFEKNNNNKSPTQAEVDAWIIQLSDYEFQQMRNEAADYFSDASREYLEGYIEDQKVQAVNNSILSTIDYDASKIVHVAVETSRNSFDYGYNCASPTRGHTVLHGNIR